jgi:hypothetical protein
VLVVHGGWVPRADGPGRLALWAEDPAPTSTSSVARADPAASSRGVHAPRWPRPERSSDDIRERSPRRPTRRSALSLPGTAQGPLPSPETGRETPTAGATAVLDRSGAAAAGEAALPALGALADPDPDGPWLARRRCAICACWPGSPAISPTGAACCRSCDRGRRAGGPVAAGAHRRGRGHVPGLRAAAMPPVCRCAVDADGRATRGRATLRDALDAMVDAAARSVMPERCCSGIGPGRARRWPTAGAVALTAADPALPGAPADESRADAALDDWMRARAADAHGPVRVSFRLVEPAPGQRRWRLEFALQSAEDPSLYLPAPDLWAGARMPGLPPAPGRDAARRAGPRGPAVPAAARGACCRAGPRMTLDTGEAHEFLRQAAPLLQAAGFGVQLPPGPAARPSGSS